MATERNSANRAVLAADPMVGKRTAACGLEGKGGDGAGKLVRLGRKGRTRLGGASSLPLRDGYFAVRDWVSGAVVLSWGCQRDDEPFAVDARDQVMTW